jgi:hypothetical protein
MYTAYHLYSEAVRGGIPDVVQRIRKSLAQLLVLIIRITRYPGDESGTAWYLLLVRSW